MNLYFLRFVHDVSGVQYHVYTSAKTQLNAIQQAAASFDSSMFRLEGMPSIVHEMMNIVCLNVAKDRLLIDVEKGDIKTNLAGMGYLSHDKIE